MNNNYNSNTVVVGRVACMTDTTQQSAPEHPPPPIRSCWIHPWYQHGNLGKFLSLCFFSLCYIIKYKTFFPYIDIQLYQHLWKWGKVEIGKTRNCVWKPSHNFSFSLFPLVLIFNNYFPKSKARWSSGRRRDEVEVNIPQ